MKIADVTPKADPCSVKKLRFDFKGKIAARNILKFHQLSGPIGWFLHLVAFDGCAQDVLGLLILLNFSWAKIRNLPVSFRMVPVTLHRLNLVRERSQPCSRMTALGRRQTVRFGKQHSERGSGIRIKVRDEDQSTE